MSLQHSVQRKTCLYPFHHLQSAMVNSGRGQLHTCTTRKEMTTCRGQDLDVCGLQAALVRRLKGSKIISTSKKVKSLPPENEYFCSSPQDVCGTAEMRNYISYCDSKTAAALTEEDHVEERRKQTNLMTPVLCKMGEAEEAEALEKAVSGGGGRGIAY